MRNELQWLLWAASVVVALLVGYWAHGSNLQVIGFGGDTSIRMAVVDARSGELVRVFTSTDLREHRDAHPPKK